MILVLTDDGRWVKEDSGTDNRLFAVSVNSNGVAVAVGGFGTVLLSGNYGQTWKSVAPDWNRYAEQGEQPHLYDVHVDEKGVIILVGEFGLILRSRDNGASWQALHKGQASLFALELRADGGGYAVGQDGAVLRTADGGATWADVPTDTKAILLGVHSEPSGRVLITGMHDMLYSRNRGVSWSHLGGELIGTSWYQGVANTLDGAPMLVVGNAGQILRVTD